MTSSYTFYSSLSLTILISHSDTPQSNCQGHKYQVFQDYLNYNFPWYATVKVGKKMSTPPPRLKYLAMYAKVD